MTQRALTFAQNSKATFLTLLLASFFCQNIRSQSCLPDTTYFTSQSEIYFFKANYPGCKTIEGHLYISGDNITTLDSLHEITAIGGGLTIENTPFLTDLAPLKQIKSIGGDLRISQAPGLTSLDGLDSLHSIGGNLDISENSFLQHIDALGHLEEVGGINVSFNNALTNLNSLAQINYVPGNILIASNPVLANLSGLSELDSVGGNLDVRSNQALTNLFGLARVRTIGGNLNIDSDTLEHLYGLDSLHSIGGTLEIQSSPKLIDLVGLGNLRTIGGDLTLYENNGLKDCYGINNLGSIGGYLSVYFNNGLTQMTGLENLETVGGSLVILGNYNLSNLAGLEKLSSVGNNVVISATYGLADLHGLENLTSVAGDFEISVHNLLTDISALSNLHSVGGNLVVLENKALTNLAGLEGIVSLNGYLTIGQNWELEDLSGLQNLVSIAGNFTFFDNYKLLNFNALTKLNSIGGDLYLNNNYLLSDCDIFPICDLLKHQSDVFVENNAPGCATAAEIESQCGGTPVEVAVQVDFDCLPGNPDLLVPNAQVRLDAPLQMALRPTGADGVARFGYLDNGPFAVSLPQFPTNLWGVCQDSIQIAPGAPGDTIKTAILVYPFDPCPELTLDLALPTNFRGCLVSSDILVSVRNTGAVLAEGVKIAVVLPPVLELLSTEPLLTVQNGDTLIFAIGNLKFFESAALQIRVKTRCDTFLQGQTLCVETFASMNNACPDAAPTPSEIKLTAQCIGDSLVRFTLKNIGESPTQGLHQYTIIKNAYIIATNGFSLDVQDSLNVDLPADGATYRMEATKYNNGALTAVGLENCRELTPGLINAFWLDEGPPEYDIDCSQVIGAFDPNQKTATPTGIGAEGLIAANRPLQYTIDFQNTGTDTAFRVLLRDVLPSSLDLNTFRPGIASHPCTWEIRGQVLDVLFSPIALPDSNVNEPASRGFFSFDIGQKPDLPDGTNIQNTASIIFDFNPPIVTNTVRHTIGQLTVRVDAPQQHSSIWEVWGNPTRDVATFRARESVGGEKRFELYDAAGRLVRAVQFSEQSFDFQRELLPGGLYFFKIADARGRVFSGKIVVAD